MIKDSNGVYCITLPSDYSSLKNISISGSINTVLTLIPDDSLLNYNSFNTTGNPLFYSIQNNTVYFSPAPSSAFTVNFVYYQDVPPLATNNTNWLLTQYPMVYLYGALIEGCTYIQDFEQQQLYQDRFDDAIEDIWQNYAMESFSGSPLRSISDYTV